MFNHCESPHAVKKLYRKLAFENHPDLGGDTRTMQDINEAYHDTLSLMSGQVHLGSDGKSHKYTYSYNVEQAVMDKLATVLALNKPELRIRIIGTWLWVEGTVKADQKLYGKDGCGLCWHSKRLAWFFHSGKYKSHYNKQASLDDLAAAYGTSEHKSNEAQAARIAA